MSETCTAFTLSVRCKIATINSLTWCTVQ